jgi:class 3 adenylate cyclase
MARASPASDGRMDGQEAVGVTTASQPEMLATAQAAMARHEWRKAYEALSAADARTELPPEGLELLAESAWWTGQLPAAIDARERAFAAATRQGDVTSAVLAAINLAQNNLLRMSIPVADAWLKRADQLLSGVEENEGHGWLAAMRAFYGSLTGDTDLAFSAASSALEIGKRLGKRDLVAFALSEKASILVARGEVEEGLALADEATMAALTGELEPHIAGGVYCATIEACSMIGDFNRAAEWTEAQDRWCRREGINGFPGMCRLFRSGVKTLRGSWPEAEAEARVASDELRGYIPAAAGIALYQIGEIRLYRGDLPAAEEALRGANRLGQDIEPANSLLLLAQGKQEAAAAAIRLALEEPGRQASWMVPPGSDAHRLKLLPAQCQIALGVGDLQTAALAADALELLADRFQTLPAQASAKTARGAVEAAQGNPAVGAQKLREAIGLWSELRAPYEAARTRVILAQAYLADDAPDRATLELRTARDSFEELGAALDLRRTDESLAGFGGEAAAVGSGRARTTRAFMFTDIVDSTRLAETLGDEAWDKLQRWHDRVIRTAAAEQGGEEVKATGDGFFLAFADPGNAIAAAIAMQRRLAAHRDEEGFAPPVRIGIHQAEANRVGLDYAGTGVNQAARIGAAALGGEVLVSAATLASARHTFSESAKRTIELKGIAAPVEVVSVDWR